MAPPVTLLEHLTRGKPCRVTFRRSGLHQFGGSPAIDYTGITPPAPIHHLFTLDTWDFPSCPIQFEAARYLPLVYPLNYSWGGGEISYRVISDGTVEILHLSDYSPDDPPCVLFDELPERRAALKPLTYAEQRTLESDVRERSFLDRQRMKRLWNGECFRVGGMLEYEPAMGTGPCPAPDNEKGENCKGWRFAHFPATKIPFGDIWHDYSSDVWFCFAVCFDCGRIHAFNECT